MKTGKSECENMKKLGLTSKKVIYIFVIFPKILNALLGGSPADITDHPHVAQLLLHDQYFCTASILSNIWLISAAHCTSGTISTSLSVRVGSEWIGNGILIRILNKHEHPLFCGKTYDFDLSLIRLRTILIFGINIRPINVSNAGKSLHAKTVVSVSGWGETYHGGPNANQLHTILTPIIPMEKCRESYGIVRNVTHRMICTMNPKEQSDACSGDSGGPLVHKDTLIGLVSWGTKCGFPILPSVYTRLSDRSIRGYIFKLTGI